MVYTKQAQKDAKKLAASGLKPKAQELLTNLAEDPFQKPPSYEKLVDDLRGAYSRRINIQRRLVYQVLEDRESRQSPTPVEPLQTISGPTLHAWQRRSTMFYMRNTLTIRTDDSLREALTKRAKSQGKSVSTLVREILEEAVAERPLRDRIGHLRGSLGLDNAATGDWRENIRNTNWRPITGEEGPTKTER